MFKDLKQRLNKQTENTLCDLSIISLFRIFPILRVASISSASAKFSLINQQVNSTIEVEESVRESGKLF